MKFLRRFWWLIAILILGGVFIGWRTNSVKAKSQQTKEYIVGRQTLVDEITLSGDIEAEQKASLKFQTSGLLAWVGVKEGDVVKKWQAIASLDKRELQNSLNQYLNTYTKERWDFEQAESDNKDWQTRGMSDLAREEVKRSLQKNQFDLNNSVLAVESRSIALKYATLVTPIEGIVTKVDSPLAGANITPASAEFVVMNPDSLYFSATADQTEVIKLSASQSGMVTLDPFEGRTFEAKIKMISFVPKAGESGTVYEIKINLDLGDVRPAVKVGMTGDINFHLREIPNVLTIPEAYLKKEKNDYFVTKDVNGKRVKTQVVIGSIIEGLVEIKEGLNDNDKIYN